MKEIYCKIWDKCLNRYNVISVCSNDMDKLRKDMSDYLERCKDIYDYKGHIIANMSDTITKLPHYYLPKDYVEAMYGKEYFERHQDAVRYYDHNCNKKYDHDIVFVLQRMTQLQERARREAIISSCKEKAALSIA